MSVETDVTEFNLKFGLPLPARARLLDKDAEDFRVKHMREEVDEFAEACARRDVVDAADALVDLVYVAVGTAVMMGVPFDACWDAVHAANMRKVRASTAADPRSKRGHALDVVKPAGWVAPDVAAAIREAGR